VEKPGSTYGLVQQDARRGLVEVEIGLSGICQLSGDMMLSCGPSLQRLAGGELDVAGVPEYFSKSFSMTPA
jgi:hypothetical protein